MSALVIDEKVAAERLNASSNLAARFNGDVTQIVQRDPKKGPYGHQKVPPFLKIAMAVEARSGGNHTQIAKENGVTRTLVTNLANGKASSMGGVDGKIEPIVKDQMTIVKDTAMDKLMMTLGLITEENLRALTL